MSTGDAATTTTSSSNNHNETATISSSTMTNKTQTGSPRFKVTSSSSSSSRSRPVRLTNTNTDNLCTESTASIFQKYLYRFNLWTGLYMLNPYEQLVFHILCWFSLCVSLAYFAVFASGFYEGLKRGARGSTEESELWTGRFIQCSDIHPSIKTLSNYNVRHIIST